MDDFDFSIGDFDLSGGSDLLPSEFTVDSSDTSQIDYLKFTGSDSLNHSFGPLGDLLGNVGGFLWDTGRSAVSAFSGLDSSTKGLLASMVAGGGQAYLQGRAANNQLDAQRAMSKEQFDRVQEARRIPEGVKLGTAGGFK